MPLSAWPAKGQVRPTSPARADLAVLVRTTDIQTITLPLAQARGVIIFSGVARPGDLVGHKHGKWSLAA